MNRTIHFIVVFVLFALILFPCTAQDNDDKEVIVTGESLIESDGVPAARQRAIDEALRKSVEQGIGVFIKSDSIVENFQLIEDRFFSKTMGYVKKYDVLSERQVGKRFRISVRAVVSLDIIKKDLIALSLLKRQMNYPRLMIIVANNHGESDDAARSARIQLEKHFAESHFDLVDPRTSEKLHNNIEMLLNITRNDETAAKIGLEHHAEVIITGLASSQPLGRTNTGFESAQTKLSLRIINPTTAKLLASTEEIVSGVGSTAADAMSNAASKAGEKLSDYARKEIIHWWEEYVNHGIQYRITLKNIYQYPEAISFEDAVRSIYNVVSLNERVFAGGFLEIDVIYKGEKSDLTRNIFKTIYGKPGFEKLNVEVGTGNNIIFTR